jgi:hypothetical protein
MSRTTFSGPVKSTGGFITGSDGSTITKILKGTVAVNLASLDTLTGADLDVAVTGAVVGDSVIFQPPATDMTAGLLVGQAWVAEADVVTVRVYNFSGGTINEGSADWIYTLIRA